MATPAAPSAPTPPRPKHKGSAQLFQNPVLEHLTHTHFALPVAIFLSTVGVSLYYCLTRSLLTGLAAFGLFLAGLLLFTLAEYLLHRFVYHIATTTPGRAKFQYTMHGVHHEYPKDKTRLAMPPILTVCVASLLFFVFCFVFGCQAFGLLAGFTFGYACNLFVYYVLHMYAPPKNALKRLWHHHAMHHYTQEAAAFCVSTMFWNQVFGTMPRQRY